MSCYTNRDTNVQEEEEQFSSAMQVIGSSRLTLVLKAVIELQVLNIIAKEGPGAQLSAFEIALRLPPSANGGRNPNAPEMLDRMLRFLASYSILTCSILSSNDPLHSDAQVGPRRLYGLAPVAKYFVPKQDEVSLESFLRMALEKAHLDSWSELKGAVLEGGLPFERVHKMHVFEYTAKDPRLNEIFNEAMMSLTTILIKKILESYKGFEQLQTLVDVGGGLGVTLNLITSKYPHLKAINFDLPHVIEHAPCCPGVEHISGDMFESIPKADAIFLKWILHDWSDDRCLKLLKNCHKALPDNGKVIVVDAILPVIPDSSDTTKQLFCLDLVMMTETGGKERTEQEFLTLAIGGGFSGIKLECSACDLWIMEFYK